MWQVWRLAQHRHRRRRRRRCCHTPATPFTHASLPLPHHLHLETTIITYKCVGGVHAGVGEAHPATTTATPPTGVHPPLHMCPPFHHPHSSAVDPDA